MTSSVPAAATALLGLALTACPSGEGETLAETTTATDSTTMSGPTSTNNTLETTFDSSPEGEAYGTPETGLDTLPPDETSSTEESSSTGTTGTTGDTSGSDSSTSDDTSGSSGSSGSTTG